MDDKVEAVGSGSGGSRQADIYKQIQEHKDRLAGLQGGKKEPQDVG